MSGKDYGVEQSVEPGVGEQKLSPQEIELVRALGELGPGGKTALLERISQLKWDKEYRDSFEDLRGRLGEDLSPEERLMLESRLRRSEQGSVGTSISIIRNRGLVPGYEDAERLIEAHNTALFKWTEGGPSSFSASLTKVKRAMSRGTGTGGSAPTAPPQPSI